PQPHPTRSRAAGLIRPVVVIVREVHVLVERIADSVGEDRRLGHPATIAEIETASPVSSLPAHTLPPLLRRRGHGGLVAAILPFPVPPEIVQLGLQLPLLVPVGLVLDQPFQVPLPFALWSRWGGYFGPGIVARGAESSATQLELDQVVLDLDLGDHHR